MFCLLLDITLTCTLLPFARLMELHNAFVMTVLTRMFRHKLIIQNNLLRLEQCCKVGLAGQSWLSRRFDVAPPNASNEDEKRSWS